MQAALMLNSRRAQKRKERIKRGFKAELPSNVATKQIGPFPRYPPQSWCAQGKAAWQEAAAGAAAAAARRCSVVADGTTGHRSKQTEAHLRWMKRNRIHDLSYGGSSSDEEDGFAAKAANAVGSLLYIGLGTTALGLVISFVGTGDKGFKTPELRWTGPALLLAGLTCCLLRILLCMCPGRCLPRTRARAKEPAAERLLLTERPPREPPLIREPPPPPPPPPPKPETPPAPTPTPVPPAAPSQPRPCSPIELLTLDGSSLDISSISSSEPEGATVIETDGRGKLSRPREPAHARRPPTMTRTVTFADTPNVIAPPNEAPPPPAEIVLTPSNLAR